MPFNKTFTLAISFLTILYFIISLIIKPSMYNDSALGFITMKSMLSGAPFNYISTIDLGSIDKNLLVFNSTWAPGQYLVPMFFIKYIGLNIGEGILITNFLMSASGLLGFYFLFKALQFDKNIILISLFIIVCQRFYSISYSIYNGGETILFGCLPWIILMLISLNYDKLIDFLYFIILSYIGFLSKFSFIIIAFALTLFLVIRDIKSISKTRSKEALFILIKYSAFYIIFLVISYITFISRGLYNAQTFNFKLNITHSLFVFAEPVGSIFSLDDLYQRIFEYPGYNISESLLSIAKPIYYFILGTISIFTVKEVLNFSSSYNYKILLISFLTSFTGIFLLFYNKTEITSSMEMRHFRSVGFLVLPGLLHYLKFSKNSFLSFILYSIIGISCLYGVTSFLQREKGLLKKSNEGYNGFSHTLIDKATLVFLKQLDKQNNRDGLIYVPDAATALEFDNIRTLISHADFESLSDLKTKSYSGKTIKLYVLIQTRFKDNGKTKAILSSFKNYQNFITLFKNDEFTIFEGVR